MKESYDEELAIHIGLDPYAEDGNVLGVASARGTGRLGYGAPKSSLSCVDLVMSWGRQHVWRRHGEPSSGTAES